jgi:hypothetical protein
MLSPPRPEIHPKVGTPPESNINFCYQIHKLRTEPLNEFKDLHGDAHSDICDFAAAAIFRATTVFERFTTRRPNLLYSVNRNPEYRSGNSVILRHLKSLPKVC